MENLERLYNLLSKEIKRIVDKGTISPQELDNVNKAVCLMEKIDKMASFEEYDEVQDSYKSTRSRGWENGRSPVTGRHVGRYNHANGQSGHSIKDRMINKLEEMMDETSSEYERNEISSYIRKIEADK